mmetsp:Transcript_50457/g.155901  ORF Transcript_50457/g.155901 Transcript_50457/m.155901 type:complete len:209 (+) Transcript_50457:366-992(+)
MHLGAVAGLGTAHCGLEIGAPALVVGHLPLRGRELLAQLERAALVRPGLGREPLPLRGERRLELLPCALRVGRRLVRGAPFAEELRLEQARLLPQRGVARLEVLVRLALALVRAGRVARSGDRLFLTGFRGTRLFGAGLHLLHEREVELLAVAFELPFGLPRLARRVLRGPHLVDEGAVPLLELGVLVVEGVEQPPRLDEEVFLLLHL